MKHVLLCLTLFIGVFSWSQKTAKISVEMRNPYPDQDKAYLIFNGKVGEKVKQKVVDSCDIKNGLFSFEVEVDELSEFIVNTGDEYFAVYMQKGDDITTKVNTKMFDETLSFTGTGAERNNMNMTVYLISERYSLLIQSAIANCYDHPEDTTNVFKAVNAYDSLFAAYIDDELQFYPELEAAWKNKVAQQKNASKYYLGSIEETAKLRALEKNSIGKEFKNFSGINLNGDRISLKDFYGKPIILDFWATWCGPCKAEFPGLRELEEKYGEKINIVSVGVWCKEDDWRKMAIKEEFKLNIYLTKEESEGLQSEYMLNSIPRYVMLDKTGKVININAVRPSLGLEDLIKKHYL
ncbi:AhpC/TSA family protein [Paracrocinitomix mangrovi]|uniref:TlpA disulfide reductase family protein n=1 Tax=Paracrocinitomix mangrovi TaxID=2862509 RepID=UPI001C8DCAFE|nr:TlpA disulfide reductase family protein [Paracrocinitomix mangrovi]UKN00782.1 AhpC/TSA family protein [Paracrocinitomix mangrovi]